MIAGSITIFLFIIWVLYANTAHAEECQKLETFVEKQSASFPDLVVVKLIPVKAQLLVEFVNKYTRLKFRGDVVIVGTYTNQSHNRVGYAIFDDGCLVYGEAVSDTEWQSVQQLIFGKTL